MAPSKQNDVFTIAFFLLSILAPGVDMFGRPPDAEERGARVELRPPARFPRFAWNRHVLQFWPMHFERWYADHFGLRDVLVRTHSRLKLFVFGTSPTDQLVVGSDGWFFTTASKNIDAYRGVDPLTEQELEAWRVMLERRRDWLRERDIRFVYAIAPSKYQIYPERMPRRYTPVGPNRLDQLMEYMTAHSDFAPLDLRPSQLAAKERDRPGDPAYFPYGTHWTDRGAFAAYAALNARLTELFPDHEGVAEGDFQWNQSSDPGDSWAERLYLESDLPSTSWRIVAPKRPRPERIEPGPERSLVTHRPDRKRTALVTHDSFGRYLRPFLNHDFKRTHFVWKQEFDTALIEGEHPDVVIQVFVDRHLVSLTPE